MQNTWMHLMVFIVIIGGGMLCGCAHEPVSEPLQAATEIDQPQKSPSPSLASDKDKGEASSPRRANLPGLQREITIFLSENITFGYDTYAISPAAAEVLKAKGAFLVSQPDLIVLIEGHCDERGTVEYNLALGDRRAKAARDYLCALGIAAERIQTVSYGEERPLDPEHGEEAWAKNRRCRFVILNY